MREGLVIICLLLGFSSTHAQYTDFGGWAGMGVDQKIKKDWSWSLKWENRWSMGGTYHDRSFVNAGLNYKLNKIWSAELQWRWIERQRNQGFYEPGRRFAFRLNGKAKGGPGEWKWRLMTTKAWNPMSSAEGGIVVDDLVQRVRLGYALELMDRWTLVPSYEVFSKNWGGDSPDLSSRLQVQLKHELTKKMSVSLAYVWSDEWTTTDPWMEHVMRLNVSWKLPKWSANTRKPNVPSARVYAGNGKRWSPPRQSYPTCKSGQIFISEVHAKGVPADYIELRNASSETCDLIGWSLTDELQSEDLRFGTTVLPPEGCWLGYQKGKGSFSFGISSDLETIYLKNPEGEVELLEVRFDDPNRSVTIDIVGNQRATIPSPGESNAKDSED